MKQVVLTDTKLRLTIYGRIGWWLIYGLSQSIALAPLKAGARGT